MTRTRKIFTWTFASLVVLLAVLVLIIVFFDWNRIKPPLNAKVSEELHRPFAINGNLAVVWQREPDEGGWRAWVPWPHVVAEDLSLGNPDWSKTAADGHPQARRVAHFAPGLAGAACGDPAHRPHRTECRPAAPGRRPRQLDIQVRSERPERRAFELGGGHRRDRLRQGPRHPRRPEPEDSARPDHRPAGQTDSVQRYRRRQSGENRAGEGRCASGLRVRPEGQRPVPRPETRGRRQDRRPAGLAGCGQAVSASGPGEDRRHQRRTGRHPDRSAEPRCSGLAPETGRHQPGQSLPADRRDPAGYAAVCHRRPFDRQAA